MDRDAIKYIIAGNVEPARREMVQAGMDPLPSREEMVAVSKSPVRAVGTGTDAQYR
jgi:hypothetical protein